MLDIRLIREQPEAVERALADRGGAELIKDVLARDAERRRLVRESEELKALRNKASEAIGQSKRRGEDASAEQARMREVGERIKALEADLKSVDAEIERLLLQIPNLPDPSPSPASSSCGVRLRGSSARSPTSCSTCTRASTAIPRSGCPIS